MNAIRRPGTKLRRSVVEFLEDRRMLTTFIVDTTLDTIDVNPGDGQALDANGKTSLRAAIMEANASDGEFTIELPAGIYNLTLAGSGENAAATGDLDITDDLVIIGAGSGNTIIHAGGETGLGDRIFDIRGGNFGSFVNVQIEGLTLTGGRALGTTFPENYGGAMLIDFYSNVVVKDVTFVENQAPATEPGFIYGLGGAISSRGALTIIDSRFENNTASNSGGAIFTSGQIGTTAETQDWVKLDIVNSTFTGNTARGGGAISSSVPLTIDGSTFDDNEGTGQGGAIELQGGIFSNLSLTNSTISGNRSVYGGGILNFLSGGEEFHEIVITSSTIVNNESNGILNSSSGLLPVIGNSIIAGNADSVSGADVVGSIVSLGHNLIGDGTGSLGFNGPGDQVGTAANPIDPNLALLADNGGPTQTHALLPGSPAIDAGDTENAPPTDQRGVTRPQGSAADIGAFEWEVVTSSGPIAEDYVAIAEVNELYSGQLAATHPDGAEMTFQLATAPSQGLAFVFSDGFFRYVPNAFYVGTDSFTFTVTDTNGNSDTATVNIDVIVSGPNRAPYVESPEFIIDEDQPLTASINYIDLENDPVTFQVEYEPEHGVVQFDPASPGTFTYVPDPDFFGTDSFEFRATDDQGAFSFGEVTIIVNPVNDAPVAQDDFFEINQGESLVLSGSPVSSLTMVSSPGDWVGDGRTWEFNEENANFTGRRNFDSGVTININGDSFWTAAFAAPFDEELTPGHYVDATRFPFQDFDTAGLGVSGDGRGHNTLIGEFFIYEVEYGSATANGHAIESFAASFIQQGTDFDGSIDPPLYGKIQYNTLIGTGAGILANDSDVDGDFFTAILVDGPSHGTLILNPDGTLSYTPDPSFSGVDTFTYKTNDGQLDSNVATVTITVNAVNDAPVAADDAYSVDEDQVLVVAAPGLLGNDTDIDGDALTAVLVAGPTNGSLALSSDGSFTYTPNPNFNGQDSFTYVANDGQLDSNVATVVITVNPVNDAPVATDDTYAVDEDQVLVVAAPGILGNDTDIDGDVLTAVLVAGPANGSLTLNADGSFTYTPNSNFNGQDSFTYVANDGQLDSNVATVTITVNAVNDAPVAADDAYSVDEDQVLVVAAPGLLGNDTDVDGDALTAVLVAGPTNGSLALSADGSFTYTPNPNFNGQDSFTYVANDGELDSNIATVTITVRGASQEMIVPIDIMPGNPINPINLRSGGSVQVAILSTSTFDAVGDLDFDSLTFGQTGEENSLARKRKGSEPNIKLRDVDGDGLLDVVASFEIQQTGFVPGDIGGILRGRTYDGIVIEGFDSIRIVGVPHPAPGKQAAGESSPGRSAATNLMEGEMLFFEETSVPPNDEAIGIITSMDAPVLYSPLPGGASPVVSSSPDEVDVDVSFLDSDEASPLSLEDLLALGQMSMESSILEGDTVSHADEWADQVDAAFAQDDDTVSGALIKTEFG